MKIISNYLFNPIFPRLLFLVISIALLPTVIKAQSGDPVFKQYTTREGLSHNTVNCIVQDSLGFIWFGTMDGLNRFDGYNFKVYKSSPDNKNSLCHNMVKSICLDKKGGMWIGTANGLSYFNIEEDHFTSYNKGDKSGLSYNNIEMVYCDSKENVWVATMGGGLNKFDKQLKAFELFEADDREGSLSDNNVHWVFEDSSGDIWIGTEGGGLNRMNADGKTFEYFQFEPEDGNYQALSCVRSIQEDDFGHIWVGTWGGGAGVLEKESGKFRYFRQDAEGQIGVSDSRIISILSTSNKQMLFGTEDGGINKFNFEDQTFEQLKMDRTSPFGLKSNNIKAIYEDRTQTIWLGSSGGGVFSFRLGDPAFSSISINSQAGKIENRDVYAIATDDNFLWLGTNGGGLYQAKLRFENDRDRFDDIQFKHIELESDIVHALCYDNWQRLWVGTLGGGLHMIDAGNFADGNPEIINFNIKDDQESSVSFNDIRTLYNDRSGNIWIGTAGGGLDKLSFSKEGTYSFNHFKHESADSSSLSNNDIRTIIEDLSENIWVGTSYGLNKLSNFNGKHQIKTYYSDSDSKDHISGNWINTLFIDADGLLWVGTDAGLNSINPKTDSITIFTEEDGLVNNVIKAIEGDGEGNVWITTVNGLSMYNKLTGNFYNFRESDGLLSNEFNTNAVYRQANGNIIIGGTKGVNFFAPEQVLRNNQINALLLTDFKIFNQSVKVGEAINGRLILDKDISLQETIHLNSNENSFSFEFAALDYSNADKISYQYKMDGFNKDWQITDATHRFATYTNLGGGDYEFKVRAITGIPGDIIPECSVAIQIDYPIWLRWWAFVLYLFTAGVLFLIIQNYYRNKARFREDLKMANIQREQEQELINLKQRFFMNISHELKTPLTLILGPLDRINPNNELSSDQQSLFVLMKRNASILSRLINQLMDFSKQERGVFKLNPANIEIVDFVKDLMSAFIEMASQRNILFELKTVENEVYGAIDVDKMEKVLFNLFSNAFKYTPENGQIEVSLKQDRIKNNLVIEVSDNGRGIDKKHHKRIFDRFYQIDSDSSETGTGIGLSLAKEMVNLHQGTIHLESEFGEGSRFVIEIPLISVGAEDEISVEKNSVTEFAEMDSKIDKDNHPVHDESKPLVLVVDDNVDLCSYLKIVLLGKYNVQLAYNGEEGLKLALDLIPDLIVSDVMMPKMDGVSFCNQLKKNLVVSHVPVLLLTAKTGKESTLEGFESGADDYVTKPFDTDVLLARIVSLIDNRNRIKKQLQNKSVSQVNELRIAQIDRTFLEKIEKMVVGNMASSTFSVEELGREIGMSRTTLYRKIKSLVGMTAIEYIRLIRLNQAMKFFQNGTEDISLIAEKVGFMDIEYFKKCFKKQFGEFPKIS